MTTLVDRARIDKRAAALNLARHGCAVFRIVPGSKRPYRHSRGHLDGTVDPATITALWTATPDADIGVACVQSDIVVFDIDVYHGAERADLGDDLPDTWEVETPRGGWHIYFRCADARVQFAGTLCRGVDVKRNGYTVAPPSSHPNGGRYRWVIGHSPDDLPLVPLPPALAARAADRLRHGCDRLQRDGSVLALTVGTRNVKMFKLACALRAYGIDVPALTAALLAINEHHVHPALPEHDVRALAHGVCRRYPMGAA